MLHGSYNHPTAADGTKLHPLFSEPSPGFWVWDGWTREAPRVPNSVFGVRRVGGTGDPLRFGSGLMRGRGEGL